MKLQEVLHKARVKIKTALAAKGARSGVISAIVKRSGMAHQTIVNNLNNDSPLSNLILLKVASDELKISFSELIPIRVLYSAEEMKSKEVIELKKENERLKEEMYELSKKYIKILEQNS